MPKNKAKIQALIVAGGGGGGGSHNNAAGGGGGGGLIFNAKLPIYLLSYPVVVGAGGAAGTTGLSPTNGGNGGDSSFGALGASGGGGGGAGAPNNSTPGSNGSNGASGGGGGGNGGSLNPAGQGGTGISGQGYLGAPGVGDNAVGGGGGGGGAGEPATIPPETDGSDGIIPAIAGNTTIYYGGGGGGAPAGGIFGIGGKGGGGNSFANGTANTGGGGGGCFGSSFGHAGPGSGGSGIVIIAYHTNGSDGILPLSTGGTITTVGLFTVHTFTSNDTFVPVYANLIPTSLIEVTVNGTVLDISEDFKQSIQMTYSIFDARDPQNVKNEFSKSITFPLTATNAAAFNYPHKTRNFTPFAPGSQPAAKQNYPASIQIEGITVFSGLACLWTAFTDQNRPDAIEVFFFGAFQSWYNYVILDTSAANFNQPLFLKDIWPTSSNHIYREADIVASWAATPGTLDYIYTVKSYGQWVSPGQGLQVNDMYPDIFLWAMFKYYFQAVGGFTIKSSFYNSSFFQGLIIPFFGDFSVNELAAQQSQARVSTTSNQSIINGTTTIIPIGDRATLPDYDPSGNYNISTQKFTVSRKGYYSVNFGILLDIVVASGSSVACECFLRINSGAWKQITNTQFINSSDSLYDLIGNVGDGAGNRAGSGDGNWWYPYNATDTIEIAFQWASSGSDTVTMLSGSFVEFVLQTSINNGDALNFNEILDSTIPVNELIKDVFLMFNMRCYTDYKRKIIYFEPRDNFYYSNNFEDWTEKLDISTPVQKDLLLQLYNKSYIVEYAQDSSDAIVKTLETDTDPYQSQSGQLAQGFTPGLLTIGLKHFAPTATFSDPYNQLTPGEIPRFWQSNENPPAMPPVSTKIAPRILFTPGIGPFTPPLPNIFYFLSVIYPSPTIPATTQMPIGWAIDLFFSGQFQSLAFCDYTNSAGVVQPGLFSSYWANYFRVVNEGHLLTCSMKITARDISALLDDGSGNSLWRKPIYIIDGYYTLHQIIDYDPFQKTCKVEFLSYFPPIDSVTVNPKKKPPGKGGLPGGWNVHLQSGSGGGTGAASAVLNNGSGNSGQAGQGQVNLSIGGATVNPYQIALGTFPDMSSTNTFMAVGNGTAGSPSNLMVLTFDNKLYINGVQIVNYSPPALLSGTATLVSGTVTVSQAGVTSGSIIGYSPTDTGNLTGELRITYGTNTFTIASYDLTGEAVITSDTVTFKWWVIKL